MLTCEHQVHVLARALEDFNVALLLAEDHVPVVSLVGRVEGCGLAAHLDEGFS